MTDICEFDGVMGQFMPLHNVPIGSKFYRTPQYVASEHATPWTMTKTQRLEANCFVFVTENRQERDGLGELIQALGSSPEGS